MGARLIGLCLGDDAIIHHGIQHQAGALLGAQQVAPGREDGRRAGQGRQHRGLGQGQIARAGAEIDMRRAIHAIGAAAQIDAVEIELQDLLLGQRFLQPRRVDQLGQLARHGALLVGVDDLGGLLADGRAARHPVVRPHIQQQRARQAQRIDAVMGIEAPVLHGDEGGRQIFGHLVQRQPFAHDGAAMAHVIAVRIQEGEGQRPVDGIKVDAGIKLGRKQAQHQRREVQQRQGHRDHRHGDGESRAHSVWWPGQLAPVAVVSGILRGGHGRDC